MEVSVAEGRWVEQKGNSEQTFRDMNAYENDYKYGGRINTMLNSYGYKYEGLKRKSVLIYAAREAILA